MRCEHKRQKAHGALPENLSLGGGYGALLETLPSFETKYLFQSWGPFRARKAILCAECLH